MTVPAFEFTDRAVPLVQMGRFQRLYRGKDRWGIGEWGTARWGRGPGTLYKPMWADVTCDVHEVTTDVGRSSASDRFQPATAQIIASNVDGWADGVPSAWPHFVDSFERTGPDIDSSWERWDAMEAFRPGMDQLVIEDAIGGARAATVQQHATYTTRPIAPPVELHGTYQAEGGTALMPIGPFPDAVADDVVWLSLVLYTPSGGMLSQWPITDWTQVAYSTLGTGGAGTGGGFTFYLYKHRITEEEAATDEPWSHSSMPAPWNYTAFAVGGLGENEGTYIQHLTGGSSASSTFSFPSLGRMPADGIVARIFFTRPEVTLGTLTAPLVDIAETANSPDWDLRQFLAFDGGTADPTEYTGGAVVPAASVPWTEKVGAASTGYHVSSLILPTGPRYTPESLPYEGSSGNRWAIPYVGDHFIETTITGLAAPERVWPDARFLIELYLHLAADDLTSQVAGFEWVPDWDDPEITGTLSWWLDRRLAGGGFKAGDPFAEGTLTIGPDGFPDPVVLRFEADADDGTLRLFFDGDLLTIANDPDPPDGELVAVYADYETGTLSYGRTIQPGPTRFEAIAAGTHIANPIHLEPGTLIRIGVHHQRYDDCWFFNGYVDALRPVYVPDQEDSVRIECIDALGEVGRIGIDDIQTPRELEASDRVDHILDEGEWPPALRALDDDATIMSYAGSGPHRVIDLLTQTAESCGGAVYGGPGSGDVVFRRKDWQGWDPDRDPVDGWITNTPGDADDFDGLVVCPSGWDRSWDRQDMATRVTYTNSNFGEEIVYRNADAERRWGIEEYTRDLVTVYPYNMRILAARQLRLRGPEKFPRVEAVFLDAATDDVALDLMATATFTRPHHYRCQLHRGDRYVFDQRMLVTGLRHVLTPNQWTVRIALDLANPFIAIGGRWSNPGKPRAHWGVDVWGHAR